MNDRTIEVVLSHKNKVIFNLNLTDYRKIPRTNSEVYIFQRPFLTGLLVEGPIYGEKIAGLAYCKCSN